VNPDTLQEAASLAKAVVGESNSAPCEVVIIPPYPFLETAVREADGSPVSVGAEDLFDGADRGAFTGAVSADMIKSMGVKYVLAGHSERRVVFGDTDATINRKVRKILDEGLSPILCIGESQEECCGGGAIGGQLQRKVLRSSGSRWKPR